MAAPVTAVAPAVAVRGDIAVPSVKGICQRAVLLGAVADGESEIRNFGRAADTESATRLSSGSESPFTAHLPDPPAPRCPCSRRPGTS